MDNNIIGQGVVVANRTVTINGVKYPFLPNMKGTNVSNVNNKVYIDGYELKNGKWRRTFKALFHMLF